MYGKIKNRFVSFLMAIVAVFTLLSTVPAFAVETQGKAVQDAATQTTDDSVVTPLSGDVRYGGWGRMTSNATVYSSSSLSSSSGSLSKGEGVTVIWYDDTAAYINYSSTSTSNGKFGYIRRSTVSLDPATDVGIVITASSTYYDTNYTHRAGSVSQGEYVSLISRANGWDYIEYNVSGGKRKCAFVPSSCINHQYGTAREYHFFSVDQHAAAVDNYTTVYAGPDDRYYPEIGYVTQNDTAANGKPMYSYFGLYNGNGEPMAFISYQTSSGTKYGWIKFYHYWYLNM